MVEVDVVGRAAHLPLECRGVVKGDVHLVSSKLVLVHIHGVLSSVHHLLPALPQHLAADVQVDVLLPLDYIPRRCNPDRVGVVDCVVVLLFNNAIQNRELCFSHILSQF